jgi:hypothetical protein
MKNHIVSIKPVLSGNIFFPQPDEVMKSIGISPTPRTKIKGLASLLNLQLKLSNSSLDNLGRKGIKEKTLIRLLKPIYKKLFRIHGSMKDTFKKVDNNNIHVWDSGFFWNIILEELKRGVNEGKGKAFDLTPLDIFFKIRNIDNQKLGKYLKQNTSTDEVFLKGFYDIVLPMTLLEPELHHEVITITEQLDNPNDITAQQSICFMRVQYDFYLSLIAAIDHCLVKDWDLDKSHPKGLFGNIFDLDGKTYLAKLLLGFKKGTNKNYRELAKLIPLNKEETDSGRTLHEAQIETLKAWRSGKQIPSYSKLNTFIQALEPGFDMTNYQIMGCVCLSLDRLMTRYVRDDSSRQIAQSVFSSHYYKKHFEKLGGHLV